MRLRNLETGKSSLLGCDGLFVAIGHDPATALFRAASAVARLGVVVADLRRSAVAMAAFRIGSAARAEYTRRARREMDSTPPEWARFTVTASRKSVSVRASYGEGVSREYAFRVAGEGGRADPVPPDATLRLAETYRGDLPFSGVRLELHGEPPAWSDVRALFLSGSRQFDKEFHLEGKRLRMDILPSLRVSGARPEGPPMMIFAGCRADQLPHLPKRPMRIVWRDSPASLRS